VHQAWKDSNPNTIHSFIHIPCQTFLGYYKQGWWDW